MCGGTAKTRIGIVALQIGVLAFVCSLASAQSIDRAWASGQSFSGELREVTVYDRSSSVPVISLENVTAVAAGEEHFLALTIGGTVIAWGSNSQGQLGEPSLDASATPIGVPELTSIVAIAAGGRHSLALAADGTVWAWGDSAYGQTGNGSAEVEIQARPAQVVELTAVAAIAAGRHYSLALREDGTVWSFGNNEQGQLGVGETAAINPIPLQAVGLEQVTAIACGDSHSLAVESDGSAWAWGDNAHGKLGVGTEDIFSFTPVPVATHRALRAVAAGRNHSLGLTADGFLLAWGLNASGQLGDGTVEDRFSPVEVHGVEGRVRSLSASAETSSAVTVDGEVWDWGKSSLIPEMAPVTVDLFALHEEADSRIIVSPQRPGLYQLDRVDPHRDVASAPDLHGIGVSASGTQFWDDGIVRINGSRRNGVYVRVDNMLCHYKEDNWNCWEDGTPDPTSPHSGYTFRDSRKGSGYYKLNQGTQNGCYVHDTTRKVVYGGKSYEFFKWYGPFPANKGDKTLDLWVKTCTPRRCGYYDCGYKSDGCGGTINCGGCPRNYSCRAGRCEINF